MSKSGNECTSVGACSLCSWNGNWSCLLVFCLFFAQSFISGWKKGFPAIEIG